MKSGDYVRLSEPLGDDFDQPKPVTDLDLAFPARGLELAPEWEKIPRKFRDEWDAGNEWTEFVSDWFARGWPERGLFARDDVDPELASQNLYVILGCYAFKHQHKLAAAGWLASRWFAAVGDSKEETSVGTESEGH